MTRKINIIYLATVLLLMLALPAMSLAVEWAVAGGAIDPRETAGKWFVFWALGVRLFTAGLRQAAKPAFTAESIFGIEDPESHVIVRELGFANICLGGIGLISLVLPQWRTAAAFAGGLFMGLAGIMHAVKRPEGPNEIVAMASDLFIFCVMAAYLLHVQWRGGPL
jgi:hypothetical protein